MDVAVRTTRLAKWEATSRPTHPQLGRRKPHQQEQRDLLAPWRGFARAMVPPAVLPKTVRLALRH